MSAVTRPIMSCDPPENTRTPRTIGVVYRSLKRTLRTAPIVAGSCEWKYAARRVMYPSTRSSTTMSAWLIPQWGRAVGALSILTARTRRLASVLPIAIPLSGQHAVHAGWTTSAAAVTHWFALHWSVRGPPTNAAFERSTPMWVEPSSSEVSVARSPKPSPFQSPATIWVWSHGIVNGANVATPLGSVNARLFAALKRCTWTEPSLYQ